MTPHEIELAQALWSCSFLPGSAQKRFARDLAFKATHNPDSEISLRQRHYMEIMAWRYRRQLPAHLIPAQKPLDLPPARKPPKKPKSAPEPMLPGIGEKHVSDLFSPMISDRKSR